MGEESVAVETELRVAGAARSSSAGATVGAALTPAPMRAIIATNRTHPRAPCRILLTTTPLAHARPSAPIRTKIGRSGGEVEEKHWGPSAPKLTRCPVAAQVVGVAVGLGFVVGVDFAVVVGVRRFVVVGVVDGAGVVPTRILFFSIG